jgi:hypothetical protein
LTVRENAGIHENYRGIIDYEYQEKKEEYQLAEIQYW